MTQQFVGDPKLVHDPSHVTHSELPTFLKPIIVFALCTLFLVLTVRLVRTVKTLIYGHSATISET